MAPLVLKIKGNKTFLPFSTLTSEDELSQTWRVCTKVKDSLENGSRLENLSWRLWFRQHLLSDKGSCFKKLSITTARKLSSHVPIKQVVAAAPLPPAQPPIDLNYQQVLQQQIEQQCLAATNFFQPQQEEKNNFTLPQFTSDQTNNEIVELDDIFNAFNNEFNIPSTADMGMADGWDFGIPSPTNPYYSPNDTLQHPPTQQFNFEQQQQQQQQIPTNNESDAMYVSGSTMPPPPTATLRNKLLGQQMRFNSSSQGFNTGSQTPPMSASNSASTISSAHMGALMDDSNV
jgi:hypothetical protein